MKLEWSPTLYCKGQPQSQHGAKSTFCSWVRVWRGLPFCTSHHPNSEMENNTFLLEVSDFPVNHSAVTANPNTGLGWDCDEKRSNQSAGKGNPKSNRLVLFHISAAQCYISTNKQSFPKPLPRDPLQKQTNLCRSQTQTRQQDTVENLAHRS